MIPPIVPTFLWDSVGPHRDLRAHRAQQERIMQKAQQALRAHAQTFTPLPGVPPGSMNSMYPCDYCGNTRPASRKLRCTECGAPKLLVEADQ